MKTTLPNPYENLLGVSLTRVTTRVSTHEWEALFRHMPGWGARDRFLALLFSKFYSLIQPNLDEIKSQPFNPIKTEETIINLIARLTIE